MRNSSPLKNIGLLLFRVSFSVTMMMHGWPKLEKLIAGGGIKFPDPMGIGSTYSLILAILGEFVAPILVILGFKTKIAAVPTAITMIVAFFVIHSGDSFGDREMSFLYMIAFLCIALIGGGRFSIDGTLKRRR